MAEQIVTEIVIDARPAAEGLRKYQDALQKAGVTTDEFGNKIETSAGQGFKRAASAADTYLAKLDPIFSAQRALGTEAQRAATAVDGLQQQLLRGSVGATEFERRVSLLRGRYAELQAASSELAAGTITASAALQRLSTTHAAVEGSSKRVQFAMRDLTTQSVDFFQQVATGQGVIRPFIQQMSQVQQVNMAAGVSFRELAANVGGMLARFLATPVVAFGVAIGAVVATLGVLGFAAESTNRRMLDLQNQMKATRTDAIGAAAAIEAAAKNVASSSGISTEDARKSGTAIQGAANFTGNQAALEQLIRLSGDLDKVFAKAGAGAEMLTKAMEDSGKVAKELADRGWPGMTSSLADAIQKLQDGGDRVGAFNRVLDVLKDNAGGAAEAVTPLSASIEHLINVFTTAGSTGQNVWQEIGTAITTAVAVGIEAISRLLGSLQQLRDFASRAAPEKPGALPFGLDPRVLRDFGNAMLGRNEFPSLTVRPGATEDPLEALGLPLPPTPPMVRGQTVGDLETKAQGVVNASTAGRVAALRKEIAGYQQSLSLLNPTMQDGAARMKTFSDAIADDQKKIADLTRGTKEHKTEAERLAERLDKNLQKTNEAAASQDKLAAAHRAGGDDVVHLTAEMKAEADVIGAGLLPSMAGYLEAVEKQTAANENLARSTGSAKIEESINKINEQTAAQLEINAAYDGSELSLTRATNAQKAYADAVAAGIAPGDQFNDVVARETEALDRASAATQALADRRQALSELSSMFTQAFSTISSAITNAMFAGRDAVINFGQIAKAVAQQILSAFLQLAILNPLLNSLFGARNLTLGSAMGALGGASGGGDPLTIAGTAGQIGLMSRLGSSIGANFGSAGPFSQGGLLGGLGGVSVFMDTPVWAAGGGLMPSFGSLGLSAGETGLLGAAGISGPSGAGLAAAGVPAATLGGILGGVGGGFTAGSPAGPFVQSKLGKAA